MNNDSDQLIRLQLGEELNEAFCEYIKSDPLYQQHLQHFTVEQIKSKPPILGFGFTVPPELLISAAQGFVGAIGAGLGKVVWDWLKGFFSNMSKDKKHSPFIVTLGGKTFTIDPSRMSDEPPSLQND